MKPNPFLADNNIFSKVVNPIRKPGDKPQTPKGTSTSPQIKFTPSQTIATNPQLQPGKISFGEPNQVENRYENRAQITGEDGKKRVIYDSRNGQQQQYAIGVSPSSPNNYGGQQVRENRFQLQKGNLDPRGAFQTEINLNMEARNEPISQFPARKNPFIAPKEFGKPQKYASPETGRGRPEQLSPIVKRETNMKVDDSGFLNIEALDDDISRFLESNENKEEMKKLLGMRSDNRIEGNGGQRAPFKEAVRLGNANRAASPTYQPTIQQYTSRQGSRQIEQSYDYRPNPYSSLPGESKSSRMVTSLGQKNVQSPSDRYQLPSFKPLETQERPQENSSNGNRLKQEMNRLAFQNGARIFMTTAEKIVTVPYQLGPL